MFDLNPRFNQNSNNHHANYKQRFEFNNNSVHFRLETMEEDSGVSSPPVWGTISPPDSPVRFPDHRSLSPASRAQAIARGQREMMEIVNNMPETSYELSLKDIVDQRKEHIDETQSVEEGEAWLISHESQQQKSQQQQQRRKNNNKRIIVKTGSVNHNKGLLINMFFPFSIGSKKKKNSSSYFGNSGNHGKFSAKAELLDKSGYDESLGVTSSSGESAGRSGSSGSSSSSTASSLRNNSDRRENRCTYGCWSLFPFRKKKS